MLKVFPFNNLKYVIKLSQINNSIEIQPQSLQSSRGRYLMRPSALGGPS